MSQRRRSFWAWGWQDRFPDAVARKRIGLQAQALLGCGPLEERAPPSLATIELLPPRIEIPPALQAFATTDRFARARRTYGKSYRDLIRGLNGDFSIAPDVVATPANEMALEAVFEWAEKEKLAVIPYGGGSSVVGGVEGAVSDSYGGVVCLDLGGFSGVREIDEVSGLARIGAGTMGPDLERELGGSGLTLRFFPQSFEHSTLGGWIATRAAGHFASAETHIDDLTAAITALTPRGRWKSRLVPASGAGPSPDRLLLGSEGALAVITEAWMRVRLRPRYRVNASLLFSDWKPAVEALRAIASARLWPTNARLLDSRETLLHQVEGAMGKQLLLLGFESSDQLPTALMNRALALARAEGGRLHGGVIVGDANDSETVRDRGSESWRSAFIDTPYMFSALVTLGVVTDTFETACTWSAFADLHHAVIRAAKQAMAEMKPPSARPGLVSCRITHVYPDGLAPYFTFATTAKVGAELETWTHVKKAVSDALLAAGGTITHHHAVGRVHMPWYRAQQPAPFRLALEAVKHQLDPNRILNPGVLV